MDVKPRPNGNKYREILNHMTPEEKILKIIELNQLGKELFIAGYLERNPFSTKEEAIKAYRTYKFKCPNNNY